MSDELQRLQIDLLKRTVAGLEKMLDQVDAETERVREARKKREEETTKPPIYTEDEKLMLHFAGLAMPTVDWDGVDIAPCEESFNIAEAMVDEFNSRRAGWKESAAERDAEASK